MTMAGLEFPYVNRRGQSYPIVPVTLYHRDREVRTEALVDSGASISTFQGDLVRGRADFFERFVVSFDERNQRLSLHH
jgi:hypothetical protein